MRDRKLVGEIGESIARKYLENKGYQILEQNYRTRYAEIDLVVKKGQVLRFIEVRTKKGELFGTPEDTINKKKLFKLKWNATAYAARKKWTGLYSIDAICILLTPDNRLVRIEHYKDIVQ